MADQLTRLCGNELKIQVGPALAGLEPAQVERIQAVVDLAQPAEFVSFLDCLPRIYPTLPTQHAVRQFSNLRSAFNRNAEKLGLPIRFEADKRERGTAAGRRCWFTGPNRLIAQAEQMAADQTADLEGRPLVHSLGVLQSDLQNPRNDVLRIFVSYAHEGRGAELARDLLDKVAVEMRLSRTCKFELLADRDIAPGNQWHPEIQAQIDHCDLGLLLVGRYFLISDYIAEHELPHFAGPAARKPGVPVGMQEIDFERYDLRELSPTQFFIGQAPGQLLSKSQRQFYDGLRGDRAKAQFAARLVRWLEEWVAKHLPHKLQAVSAASNPATSDSVEAAEVAPDPADLLHCPPQLDNHVPTRGHPFNLAERQELEVSAFQAEHAKVVVEELETWARNTAAPPFYAVLGEYGLGKTTTLQQLTRKLLTDRKTDPTTPLPIYIDLRDYVSNEPRGDYIPTLEELLDTVIQRGWKLTSRELRGADLIRLVREQGAVILFDGLDEKLVHMDPTRTRAFIKTLWSVLPDATRGAKLASGVGGGGRADGAAVQEETKARGKFVISCRSHYFRDVASQNNALSGDLREGFKKSEFPAIVLLPFNKEQIRAYLTSFFEGNVERADAAYQLLQTIHNLEELAQRPVLLHLITQHFDRLEQLRLAGETVNAARLYQLVVEECLSRDAGKHQLNPRHKRLLMEDLAAALWRRGDKSWSADQLEDWLDRFLLKHPQIEKAYANKDRDILKEDLRTATFVVRPTDDEQNFRFAHTSLQEFFLASRLLRALTKGHLVACDLPVPSKETLEFLGQLLQLADDRDRAAAIATLEQLLGGDRLQGALWGFRYWLLARDQGYPVPAPAHVALPGADLSNLTIRGTKAQPFPLTGANLAGANLSGCRFEWVQLDEANLQGANVAEALCLNVSAARLQARGADFRDVKWRHGSLRGADFSIDADNEHVPAGVGTESARPELPTSTPGGRGSRRAGSEDTLDADGSAHDSGGRGSRRAVSEDTLDADGSAHDSGGRGSRRAVSEDTPDADGSARGSAGASPSRATDSPASPSPASRKRQRPESPNVTSAPLPQPTNNAPRVTPQTPVTDVPGSPQTPGAHASGSPGARADTLAQLAGCQWIGVDLTGALLPAGWDLVAAACPAVGLRVESRQSRARRSATPRPVSQPVRVVSGGQAIPVYGCAFSPDGTRLLSASSEGTLRLWDADSGTTLRTFQGHTGSVLGCAFSPDGARLLSASGDKTLRLWDADSGATLRTFQGHTGWVRGCAFSPDGARLVSASADNTLRLWDADSGTTLRRFQGHTSYVLGCAFSPDGARLFSASINHTLRLWDADSGATLRTFQGHTSSVYDCAFSPDGTRLLSASDDRTLRLWDADSGETLRTFQGHTGLVLGCAFSPDGARLLSASDDKTLRLWDADSGETLRTFQGHTSYVYSCAFSPDGARVLSASPDGTMKLWDAETAECLVTFYHFIDGQMLSVGPEMEIYYAGDEAWRFIGYEWTDPRTGRERLLPAEFPVPP